VIRANLDAVYVTFLIFCRVGCCLMLMPGIGSSRTPFRVRLLLAAAVAVSLTPLIVPEMRISNIGLSKDELLAPIAREIAVGMLIGLETRMFFSGIQFLAAAVTNFIGLGGSLENPIEETEANASIAHLATLAAAVLFLVGDLHWEVLRGLVRSYLLIPPNELYWEEFGVNRLKETLSGSFLLALQIAGPFIVYAVAINVTFGIANKLTPQIPVYFVSLPFVIGGGLALCYYGLDEVLMLFQQGLASWLRQG